MRFQVPQFIEVEDKIFGPLTLKQFIYLAAGGAGAFLFYNYLPFVAAIFFIIPTVVFALALAFYKVNNKPFISVVESAFKYVIGAKLYLWKKEQKKIAAGRREEASSASIFIPKLSDSKLKDLTWTLDINQSTNPGTKEMAGKQ
jgi:hypothetical protein